MKRQDGGPETLDPLPALQSQNGGLGSRVPMPRPTLHRGFMDFRGVGLPWCGRCKEIGHFQDGFQATGGSEGRTEGVGG